MPAKALTKQTALRALRLAHDVFAPKGEPNCVLVLQGMVPLGGCVQATPLLHALRVAMPNASLVVATRGVGAQVLQHNPDISALVRLDDPALNLRHAGRALRQQLRRDKLAPAWTLVDLASPRTSTALVHTLFLPGKLAGFSLAAGLQHRSFQRDATRSYLQNDLRLAEVFGRSAIASEPRVYASVDAIERARRALQAANPKGRSIALFATQGSGGQPTQWSPERMRALMVATAKAGALPVLVGTAAQAAAIDALREDLPMRTASVAGATTIPELAAMLAMADIAVSIDTGTMHVARASNVPMVVLAPTYQDPVEWLPLGLDHVTVLRGEGTRPAGPGYMLDELSVGQAADAVTAMLQRFPPSHAAREDRLSRILSNVDHLRARDAAQL